ncbi:MAG: MiaB/RimO family radical SAM methylthiotransferase, partial [bacterium]
MNEAESRRVAEILSEKCKAKSAKLEDADLIIINSCSVRQGSEDKVYGLGQKIIPLKAKSPSFVPMDIGTTEGRCQPVVILTGCMVGGAKGERKRTSLAALKRKMSWVDEFLTYEELLFKLRAQSRSRSFPGSRRPRCNIGVARTIKEPYLIPISQGCDNFCSYCVVPYTRGKEVSRSEEEILCEIEAAVKVGYREVMLLGQNVNSWRDARRETRDAVETCMASSALRPAPSSGGLPFSRLLKQVHKIHGVEKISFLTLNPYDINDELTETLAMPKMDRYIHLPVQSGDNDVLRRMNRYYTVEQYKDIVKRMRERIPNVKIGTDIIVGFPGETKAQFENTLKLVREVGFKQIFIGIYSPREGTAAAGIGDAVPLVEKKRRHKEVVRAWKEFQISKSKNFKNCRESAEIISPEKLSQRYSDKEVFPVQVGPKIKIKGLRMSM